MHLIRWHALVALEWPQQSQKWEEVEQLQTKGQTKVARVKNKANGSECVRKTGRGILKELHILSQQAHPEDASDQNAAHLLSTDISEWLWAFSALQIQCLAPPSKTDRRHYDGGASTGLHLAITLSGRRNVRCFWEGGEDGVATYLQRSGSLYVADMTAVEHDVEYLDTVPKHECFEVPGFGLAMVAHQVRSSIFRANYSTTMKRGPGPPWLKDLFRKVCDSVLPQLHFEPVEQQQRPAKKSRK